MLDGDDDFLDYEDDSETEQSVGLKDSINQSHFEPVDNETEEDEDNRELEDDDDEDFVIRSKAKRSANRRKPAFTQQLGLTNRPTSDGANLSVPLSISTTDENNLGTTTVPPCAESPDGELLTLSTATLQTPNAPLALPPSPESPPPSGTTLDSDLSDLACKTSAM